MNRELTRFLGFLAATAAVGLVIAVLGSRFLGVASGADGAIITHLKKLERDGTEQQLAFGELRAPRLRFDRISVALDADGAGATVTSTLDFTGEAAGPAGLPPGCRRWAWSGRVTGSRTGNGCPRATTFPGW